MVVSMTTNAFTIIVIRIDNLLWKACLRPNMELGRQCCTKLLGWKRLLGLKLASNIKNYHSLKTLSRTPVGNPQLSVPSNRNHTAWATVKNNGNNNHYQYWWSNQLRLEITLTASLQRGKPPPNEYSGYCWVSPTFSV